MAPSRRGKLRGPILVSEEEMVDTTQCASWVICADLDLRGWTAIAPCPWCVATAVEQVLSGGARTTAPPDAQRAAPGTD